MKITPGKYRMRDGRIASVAAVSASSMVSFPVFGSISGDACSCAWTENGKFFLGAVDSSNDMVERLPADTPDPANEAYVMKLVRAALAEADARGFVVTVEQKPLRPLAMGHYETVPSIRQKRERAQ